MDFKLAYALLNLMYRTILHYLKKLVPFAPRFGKARFVEQYVHEGLAPFTPAARAQWSDAGRCTVCGQCDAVCPLLDKPGEFAGPMQSVVSAMRAAPHFIDAQDDLVTLTSDTCRSCSLCVSACPESIPILDLAAICMEMEQVHVDARKAHGERGE